MITKVLERKTKLDVIGPKKTSVLPARCRSEKNINLFIFIILIVFLYFLLRNGGFSSDGRQPEAGSCLCQASSGVNPGQSLGPIIANVLSFDLTYTGMFPRAYRSSAFETRSVLFSNKDMQVEEVGLYS